MRPQFGASRAWLGSLVCHRARLASALYTTAFACLMAGLATGCENKAIGRPCLTLADMPSASEAEWNDEALECPSRLCVKPAYESGSLQDSATAPFCTAECSKNSDCDDGESRDKDNINDKRCTRPFVCAVLFETGPLKCQKMCVCGDFYKDPKAASAVPTSCQAASGS